MRALITSIKKARPGKKYTVVLSIKRGKDAVQMLRLIRPLASHIIYTQFEFGTQLTIGSQPYVDLKTLVGTYVENPIDALARARMMGNDILITGSLYLVSALFHQV
jgi:folylpolyglutamate synthase/dihydropteroate synthase